MKKMCVVLIAMAIALPFAACHKPNPNDLALQELGRGNYDVNFWTDQSKRDTPLWHRAIEYCKQPPQSAKRSCVQFEGIAALQQLTAGAGAVPPPPPAQPGTLGIITPQNSKGGKKQ